MRVTNLKFPHLKTVFIELLAKPDILDTNNVTQSIAAIPVANQSNNQQYNSNAEIPVKLPPINLPPFNGEFHEWLPFSETFKSVVDNDRRLFYLKSCLKDNVIKTINASHDYAAAWELLEERYNNRRLITQRHIKILFELPNVKQESAPCIRNILDNLHLNLRALKSLNEKVDDWDSLLIHLIVSKIDRSTHKEWEKTLKSVEMPNLKQITDFLKEKCQILESTCYETSNVQNYNKTSFQQNQKRQNLNVTVISCSYCKGPHKIYNCDSFAKLITKEKADFAKSLRLCFNCLSPGHRNVAAKIVKNAT